MQWPVVFPDHITHDQVKVEGFAPVSAGFVDVRNCMAFGESKSLGLKSNPDDTMLLTLFLGGTEALLAHWNCR